MARRKTHAFTLVELLVVIGIIAVLVGILMPALSRACAAGQQIACALQMRQIGNAFAMYIIEYKGTYPPCWIQDDLPHNVGNYEGVTNHSYSFATLLRKYLGERNSDPTQAGNMQIFVCPNDILQRDDWLRPAGALSYTMPEGPNNAGPDPFWAIRDHPWGNKPKTVQVAPRGIGQIWNDQITDYPMWIKTGMVKPTAMVLLLVERAYTEQAQDPTWSLGYEVKGPNYQLWSNTQSGGFYGLPLLHAAKGRENQARFNYLFADYHVDWMAAKDTVSNAGSASWSLPASGSNWKGGDFMWTIRPYEYKYQ